jgi:hypothetical protein
MSSIFSNLFKSKPHIVGPRKRQTKKQTKMQLKYHKLKLEHNKSKSKKCCKKCAGINLDTSKNCIMGVYPTCKKSGCKTKKK